MRQSHLGKKTGTDNPMFGKLGARFGKINSIEHRNKISKSCMGRIPWNKNKKCSQLAGENNGFYKKIHTKEALKKISKANKGIPWSKEKRNKILKARKGCQVGEKSSQCKLTEAIVIEIRQLYNRGLNQYNLAEKFNVTQSNIHCIIKRKSWTHI